MILNKHKLAENTMIWCIKADVLCSKHQFTPVLLYISFTFIIMKLCVSSFCVRFSIVDDIDLFSITAVIIHYGVCSNSSFTGSCMEDAPLTLIIIIN